MASLQLEVRVSNSPELAAHGVLRAIRAAESGHRQGAMDGYRDALAIRYVHPQSWSNLAALALGVDDPQAARQHAMRALQLDARHADAWVNLGVASWHSGQRREGAQAIHQALQHAPGSVPAALNYALMLRVVDRLAEAHDVLAGAVRLRRTNGGCTWLWPKPPACWNATTRRVGTCWQPSSECRYRCNWLAHQRPRRLHATSRAAKPWPRCCWPRRRPWIARRCRST